MSRPDPARRPMTMPGDVLLLSRGIFAAAVGASGDAGAASRVIEPSESAESSATPGSGVSSAADLHALRPLDRRLHGMFMLDMGQGHLRRRSSFSTCALSKMEVCSPSKERSRGGIPSPPLIPNWLNVSEPPPRTLVIGDGMGSPRVAGSRSVAAPTFAGRRIGDGFSSANNASSLSANARKASAPRRQASSSAATDHALAMALYKTSPE